jgi:homoserine dehydrogenase
MSESLKLGIAGLGTVGVGVIKLLAENAEVIAARAGRDIQVTAVSARSKSKDRGVDLSSYNWHDTPETIAQDNDVDCVIELIGGSEGAAKTLCESALQNNKPVVTANKALIAEHGVPLAKLAESSNVLLAFEAAVAGGIPIIKGLRDGLAANQFDRVIGILNGTGNYILTTMFKEQREFDDVLKEAQELGYAEADPTFDVDGIDTAHKLAIITALAYGTAPNIKDLPCEGIRNVTYRDMQFADTLGYRIKLLGITELTEHGIAQRVHPCMVPTHSALGTVDGAFNALVADGNHSGRMVFEGAGAGAGPTASAVVADIIDVAGGISYAPFAIPSDKLQDYTYSSLDPVKTAHYVRLDVIDQPGVLAEITSILRDQGISMHSFLQQQRNPDEPVQVVFTTHETTDAAMQKALDAIAKLPTIMGKPHRIRIAS